MKDLIEAMMGEEPMMKGDKMTEVMSMIQEMAEEMGVTVDEAIEKIKAKSGGSSMVEYDDSEESMEDDKPKMGGRKEMIIAMLKKKNGKKEMM